LGEGLADEYYPYQYAISYALELIHRCYLEALLLKGRAYQASLPACSVNKQLLAEIAFMAGS